MDNKAIIQSDVFKVINMMIDEKVDEMKWKAQLIVESATRKGKFMERVRTRTHEEGGTEVEMPFAMGEIENIVRNVAEYERAEKEIRTLQRWKLNLLNDYDFTHGDNTLQKAVFGEVVDG